LASIHNVPRASHARTTHNTTPARNRGRAQRPSGFDTSLRLSALLHASATQGIVDSPGEKGMPTLHQVTFESHDLSVLHRPDGVLLLDGPPLAQLLGYPDDLGALHAHCRIEGFVFGNQPRPTIWIDIRNAHRLVFHSQLPLAERLAHWLSHWLLPHFSKRSLPQVRRASVGGQHLRVLKWQGESWIALNGAMQLLGSLDQDLQKALGELRGTFR
tara:strand:+ start:1354 stop:1998 length:645 start_codon:yes stop_codon:yes gene_type:complete